VKALPHQRAEVAIDEDAGPRRGANGHGKRPARKEWPKPVRE
jgi:hypothetical protein